MADFTMLVILSLSFGLLYGLAQWCKKQMETDS